MAPVLCLVTDRHRLVAPTAERAASEDALVSLVGAAARAGVHLVQIRERDLEGRPLVTLARRCVDAVRGTTTRVLVNDRLDAALAAGAHGVHLPGHGVPAARVRTVVPRGFLVGRSVHHSSEATRVVEEGGLDYLVFGTCYPTASKAHVAPAGPQGLAAAAAVVPVPVLGIGGMTVDRLPEVASTGAAGIAAIGLFADAWLAGADRLRAVVADAIRAFGTQN